MNLLLTSGGLTTTELQKHFKQMQSKPLAELKVAFILTASLVEPGDKRWVFKDLKTLYDLNVGQVDIVDIASLQPPALQKRLVWADCLFVTGGNTAYLMHTYRQSGFAKMLPDLLKTRSYVGVSAGSMVMGYRLPLNISEQLYPEDSYQAYQVKELLGWQDFSMVPHFGAAHMHMLNKSFINTIRQQTSRPVYVLDDTSALLIKHGAIQTVGLGVQKVMSNAKV